jgi:hypothetical protein
MRAVTCRTVGDEAKPKAEIKATRIDVIEEITFLIIAPLLAAGYRGPKDCRHTTPYSTVDRARIVPDCPVIPRSGQNLSSLGGSWSISEISEPT